MTLGEKLQQFQAGLVSQLSAADTALMEKGTARLERSGMLGRAEKVGAAAYVFIDVDYTKRLEPGDILSELRQITPGA
jgi:hypothetical protein